MIGLVILVEFKFDDSAEWKGDDIYDPKSGKNIVHTCP
ncbi:MAG: DUF2147 domain-containing protein [Ferruginibacter sp.]|nr:DUF2147 domain-containing protein [Ferruginibacter sp.]